MSDIHIHMQSLFVRLTVEIGHWARNVSTAQHKGISATGFGNRVLSMLSTASSREVFTNCSSSATRNDLISWKQDSTERSSCDIRRPE